MGVDAGTPPGFRAALTASSQLADLLRHTAQSEAQTQETLAV